MKIVRTSNFNIETESEYVVADNIKHEAHAKVMLKALQDTVTDNDPNWYKLAADDYVPYKWEP